MHDWLHHLLALRRSGTPAILVTVASVKGSVPRGPGTKMVVTATGTFGTIGGGQLEYIAIDAARRRLGSDRASQLQRFPLGASLGQCCGGMVNLLIEPVSADAEWVDRLATIDATKREFVVVTQVDGRDDRSKLVVTADATSGTLGSEDADAAAALIAREILAGRPRVARLAIVRVGGADVHYLFDPIVPPGFDIVLFGAGHTARALIPVLAGLPCSVTWVDSRDDAFPLTLPPNVRAIVTDAPEAEVDLAPAGAYFLVITHSHPIDEALTERILQRTDFAYFGLIGSVSKRRQFERRLEARGMDPARFDAMTCPIGIDGIDGKEPGIIAVAVAAQLLRRRQQIGAIESAPGSDSAVHASAAQAAVRS
jgi:xanthine dehydrogenase accessory factor